LRLLFIFVTAIFSTRCGPKYLWRGHAHHSFKVILS